MGVISSKDVNNIIRKALNIVDETIMEHGSIVGYILYKMLDFQYKYSLQELIDYTMIGILHDIGLFKEGSDVDIKHNETKSVWKHSIYGYLFLRYLSPIGEKAEIVLYHHLEYRKYHLIRSKYMEIAEYLSFADVLDWYLRMNDGEMKADFFVKNSNIKFSERAKVLFLRAEKKYKILEKIKDGSYEAELNGLLGKKLLSEEYKREFLQMLIYTIDFRSEYTVIHSMATTAFATEIARLMRVPNKDIYILYYGALLHDIGKLTTPIEILEAPRKLTDEEMVIMKAHVTNTVEILKNVVNEEVLEIAARHHEKLDGSGYPRGLKGEELTIPQRIVAVADIISALYGKRSYKDSFDKQKIIDILEKDAESNKLCPKVVGCAVRNMDYLFKNFEKQKTKTIGVYMTIKEQYSIIYEKFKQFE
ncbi:HD-GYP domain-containing protein [Anaeromicropila populeti]|uniref:HDIG domain-containing protein n=1 Tax=Anaeromicropila populeti TaxID=37658 RepID=A0A1I6KLY6_9FIRM|nr:HD domain-containing phosphohydrolase [Anaeromicropila populeti]SFR92048.1 HDIG domain-containing protein [Anaeromicropila populeti]